LLLLRAISDGGETLQQWVDEFGYESTATSAPRRIKPPEKVAWEGDVSGPLAGEMIVFTGQLQIPRGEAAGGRSRGLQCSRWRDKKDHDPSGWRSGSASHARPREKFKHRKAEDLIGKGAALRIVGESDFMVMVQAPRVGQLATLLKRGGIRAGRTLPLNHRHNLEDKAVDETVDADPRRKTHHSKAGSAAVRCLAGRQ
jgi:hypothetical protein